MAGRSEINIENGIRYNGKFGAEGENISITNVSTEELKNFTSTNSTCTIIGTNTNVYEMQNNGEEELKVKSAIAEIKSGNSIYYVASGYTGQTDVSYDISEGYPDIESGEVKEGEKEYYLSSLVQTSSNYLDYTNNFADYVSYEFKRGIGYVPTLHYVDTNRHFTPSPEYSGGFVCYQDQHSSKLLFIPEGNDKFIPDKGT